MPFLIPILLPALGVGSYYAYKKGQEHGDTVEKTVGDISNIKKYALMGGAFYIAYKAIK